MSTYITSLFIAIPAFAMLVLIEMIISKWKGIKINHAADMISSLSSGLTNTIKDVIKFAILIISYKELLPLFHIPALTVENLWIAIPIAFIIEDFAGYWMHRLHHRVNIFWNRHVIHHSSEEFNLSCALRQSISITFKFAAILFIPAAIMGIDAKIFLILGPIHLFMQFWYHTRLIGKMGVLEYFLVTPSHHRVHHSINPEYLDRNYGQIFIIWDKLFGTFQEELYEVKPVYGILRPAKTWNPIIINFKHAWQITKDAWRANTLTDKIRIWFMPTGWRPTDVSDQYPLKQIEDPYEHIKYETKNSKFVIYWSWFQFFLAIIMMMHMFVIIQSISEGQALGFIHYMYALFLFVHIFSFTSTLDKKWFAIPAEIIKVAVALYIIVSMGYTWYEISDMVLYLFSGYLVLSMYITGYCYKIKTQ